jgi:hypothetical protein
VICSPGLRSSSPRSSIDIHQGAAPRRVVTSRPLRLPQDRHRSRIDGNRFESKSLYIHRLSSILQYHHLHPIYMPGRTWLGQSHQLRLQPLHSALSSTLRFTTPRNAASEFAFPDFAGRSIPDEDCKIMKFHSIGCVSVLSTVDNQLVVLEVRDNESTFMFKEKSASMTIEKKTDVVEDHADDSELIGFRAGFKRLTLLLGLQTGTVSSNADSSSWSAKTKELL